MVTKNDKVNMVTFNFGHLSRTKFIIFIFQILCIGLYQNKQLLKHLQKEISVVGGRVACTYNSSKERDWKYIVLLI